MYYSSIATGTTGPFSPAYGQFLLVDPSSGSAAATLPTAVGHTAQSIIVKNISNSTNIVTINTTSSQLIDNVAAPQGFSGAKKAWVFTSDGVNWWLTAQY
jgi:hypothetical protein